MQVFHRLPDAGLQVERVEAVEREYRAHQLIATEAVADFFARWAGLFDYLQYWISAYKAQGLRNVLEGMTLTNVALAKVVRDRWYDAVTFRIWGTGRDSTIRVADGQTVGGDPRNNRTYSEYWTLIRGAGVRGAPRTDKTCPNCGASLDTNMAGECAHCGAKITSGEFDWVLSKIEQDDSYTG